MSGALDVRFPAASLPQNEEYCVVAWNGEERRIRFHDYDQIYGIPGLYEHLFYERLHCKSHDAVSSLLVGEVDKTEASTSDLVILELGAGNGVVGEALSRRGVESIVGVDIIEEAAEAARRDRPDVYADYFVADVRNLGRETRRELEGYAFNCLVCVAALGFGDIPPDAFAKAYNLVAADAWVAFSIKEDFIDADDPTGFSRLIRRIVGDGTFALNVAQPYPHRLSVSGDPLTYVAMVGRKCSDISDATVLAAGDSPAAT